MLYDRREWAAHVQEHDPETAAVLKEMNQLFGARVMKMEGPCEDCTWGPGEHWTAEQSVEPYLPPDLLSKSKEKVYKSKGGVTRKYLENRK